VWDSLTALFAALLVARVVLPAERVRPSRLVALLASRPLVVAGLGSYAVFLWNYPLQIWLHAHGLVAPGAAGFLVNVLVLGTLCGLLSLLTYRLVEEPALRLRDASPAGWIARRRAAAT
jgi:peptidoglycan/LPS O-acetylase OafA/YrhL